MPSHSEKQRRWILYLRNKYKTKENTPKKLKWIWHDDWLKVDEVRELRQSRFHQYLEMNKQDLKNG